MSTTQASAQAASHQMHLEKLYNHFVRQEGVRDSQCLVVNQKIPKKEEYDDDDDNFQSAVKKKEVRFTRIGNYWFFFFFACLVCLFVRFWFSLTFILLDAYPSIPSGSAS